MCPAPVPPRPDPTADERYRAALPSPHKCLTPCPAMEAAIDLIVAVDEGLTPSQATLLTLRDAFVRIVAGEKPTAVFAPPRKGRPPQPGFTTSDIIAAFIELQLRATDRTRRGALAKAMRAAAHAFGLESEPERILRRHWATSQSLVQTLSTSDLQQLIGPHQKPPLNQTRPSRVQK